MSDTTRLFLLAVTVAALGLGGVALWLLGPDRLFTLAVILVCAVALGVVLAASSLPIRAANKRDATGETHYYHDGTRTVREVKVLDGRAPAQNDIRLLQLPAAASAATFPEMLRAAYTAGQLRAPSAAQPQEEELRELGPEDWGDDAA